MDVTEAVLSRRSIRAFLAKPVAPGLIAEILTKASRAPSGGNVQPWKMWVLCGEPLREFKSIMAAQAQFAIPAAMFECMSHPP